MALWQFVFDLIPSSVATVNGVAAARVSRDKLDSIELVFPEQTINAIVERVGMVLPEKQSWSPHMRIWGDEKSDDVQVGFRGTIIEDVQFRLNAGELSLPLVGRICELARTLNCVFTSRSGAIIRPYSEPLVRAITRSDSARFVGDPERYLREAIQRDPEPQ